MLSFLFGPIFKTLLVSILANVITMAVCSFM